MFSKPFLQKLLAFLLNAILITFLITQVLKTDSDKSPLIFLFIYPILILLNLIVYFGLKTFKSTQALTFKQTTIALLLLFVPLVLLIVQLQG